MGPTSVILGKFWIMVTKQSVRGGWSGVATGVRRSRVPLVIRISTTMIQSQTCHSILRSNGWDHLKFNGHDLESDNALSNPITLDFQWMEKHLKHVMDEMDV